MKSVCSRCFIRGPQRLDAPGRLAALRGFWPRVSSARAESENRLSTSTDDIAVSPRYFFLLAAFLADFLATFFGVTAFFAAFDGDFPDFPAVPVLDAFPKT
jgi:hypothetical protein